MISGILELELGEAKLNAQQIRLCGNPLCQKEAPLREQDSFLMFIIKWVLVMRKVVNVN